MLAASFVFISALVYADGPSGTQLDGAALAGAETWHRHNCQACHQLYGFGGFLGPDLTNLPRRLSGTELDRRVAQVIEHGSAQMPAFGLSSHQVEGLVAFLRAMDSTGKGQARVVPDSHSLQDSVADSNSPLARDGHALMSARGCFACHTPLVEAAVPDPLAIASRLSKAELHQVLTDGRPPGMPTPSPAFTEGERLQVMAFLEWGAEHREGIQARASGATWRWADVPWWEFE